MDGEVHVGLDMANFLAVFPLKAEGRARLIGTVRQDAACQTDKLSWDHVSPRVINWMHLDIATVNWFSTYRVHHRVSTRVEGGEWRFVVSDNGIGIDPKYHIKVFEPFQRVHAAYRRQTLGHSIKCLEVLLTVTR